MLEKFLEGIFNSFGYSVKRSLCLRGIITMGLVHDGEDEKTRAFIRRPSMQIESQE